MTGLPASLRIPAEALGALSEIGSGGQGKVYAVPARAAALPGTRAHTRLVYKEYDPATRAALDLDVLEDMVGYAEALVPDGESLGDRLAWPLALVERGGQVTGFLMRRVPDEFHFRLRLPLRAEKIVLAQAQHLLNDDRFLSDRQLPVHDKWRVEFLRDTAGAMDDLHRRGIVVGDLSPMNLLATFLARPSCFFIDCDAMRLGGRSVAGQVETTGWEIPPGEALATAASDAYKLALLAVRLVSGDQESRDPAKLASVSGSLADLARRGLSTDPGSRPTPADWVTALDGTVTTADTALPWERMPNVAPTARPGTTQNHVPRPAVPPTPVRPPGRAAAAGAAPPGVGAYGSRPYRRRRLRLKHLLVAVALIVGAVWARPLLASIADQTGGGATRGKATAEATQASRMQAVLSASKKDRGRVVSAVDSVGRCRTLNAGIEALVQSSASRRKQLAAAEKLSVGALSRGAELKSALVSALRHSRAADEAFVRWARGVRAGGCSAASVRSGDYRTATAESKRATVAKKRFVSLWAAIARSRGYSVPAETDI
jgi:hypothetical protein